MMPAIESHSNPMRVLDSKNPAVQEALEGAPALADYVSDESSRPL